MITSANGFELIMSEAALRWCMRTLRREKVMTTQQLQRQPDRREWVCGVLQDYACRVFRNQPVQGLTAEEAARRWTAELFSPTPGVPVFTWRPLDKMLGALTRQEQAESFRRSLESFRARLERKACA